MFCPNCGTKIVPGAKFCENCGQRVDFAAAEGEAEQ
ncbi:zinc-ribbon domain-containing protein, partial [Stomatobaculum sp.]